MIKPSAFPDVPASWRPWVLLLPFLVWLFLYDWGRVGPMGDNQYFYYWITYHFHYLAQGIFPLWDPFRSLGLPDVTDPRIIGVFNPLYLIIPLLMALHVPQIVAFGVFFCLVYGFGTLGLYLLVRRLCGHELPALIAYIVFLFSANGMVLFSQLVVPMLLFLTIWFIFFCIEFTLSVNAYEQRKSFAGLILVTLILAVTYLPFFSIIICTVIFFFIFFVQMGAIMKFFQQLNLFIKTHPVQAALGLLSILLTIMYSLQWYVATHSGEIVFMTTRNDYGSLKEAAIIPLKLINVSSLTVQTTIDELIVDQDLATNPFTYVPFFVFLMLALGILTRIKRWQWVVLLSGFSIFIISLADVTPIHPWLYNHVFFFRLFRNLYFLGPFIVAFLIVLAAGQLSNLFEIRLETITARRRFVIYVIIIHLLFGILLVKQEQVLWTTYGTLIGSAVLFILFACKIFDRQPQWFWLGLLVISSLQPTQVLLSYIKVYGFGNQRDPGVEKTSFSYLRPPQMEESYYHLTPKQNHDESGFLSEGFVGTKYVYALSLAASSEDLQEYVRYKFIAYDSVALWNENNSNMDAIRNSLRQFGSSAWVENAEAVRPNTHEAEKPLLINGPSPYLSVQYFDPNKINLAANFKERKFLVFNDSYHPHWRALVDGQPVPLYRANIAFKGLWIEPGKHQIEFSFGTIGQKALAWGLTFIYFIWGGYIMVLFIFRRLAHV